MERRTSRAAVIVKHNAPLVIQEVPIPTLEPGAILVRIVSSTLCGTDVHRWHGPLESSRDSLPIIAGHEPCGIIEEISGARTDILGNPLRPGDRVIWSYVSCGSCYYCSVALQPCIGAAEVAEMLSYFEAHTYLGKNAQDEIALANKIAGNQPSKLSTWARAQFPPKAA
jgi:D-arabinose 1-dehydrogenase-like Zn-dependent alcohol dehydrogenase